jgi:ketosteroid isomerase-like protein
MSQENVELGKRAYEAFNRRDLDGFLALMDPDVEALPRTLGIEGGAYTGHDGMRRWAEDILAVFDDFNVDFIEASIGSFGLENVTVETVIARAPDGSAYALITR